MIRVLSISGIITVLLASSAAWAKVLKIGVVNMQRAVSETDEGQSAERRLKKLKEKLESELNRKLKDFYDDEAKLRKAMSILKDDEKRRRVAESRQRFEALQKRYVEAERELVKKKTKAMMKITNKLTMIIQRIAKRDGYDYIFANAAVLWAPRHVDVTNEVIRQYNGK
jgi:outer membrane protein